MLAYTLSIKLNHLPPITPVSRALTVLEEKRFRRLGEVRDRTVDIRLITATHHDLGSRARSGQSRSDLYFRISTVPLQVPALRERREDIESLARPLLARLVTDLGRSDRDLEPDAEHALEECLWSGNIRELRNVLKIALVLADRAMLRRSVLLFEPAAAESDGDLYLTLEEVERRHIERVLRLEAGNVVRAAERLAVPRCTLVEGIKRHAIRLPER